MKRTVSDVKRTRHRDVETRETFGQSALDEDLGHIRIEKVNILEVWFADLLPENACHLEVSWLVPTRRLDHIVAEFK